jgi:hypothetical protein
VCVCVCVCERERERECVCVRSIAVQRELRSSLSEREHRHSVIKGRST